MQLTKKAIKKIITMFNESEIPITDKKNMASYCNEYFNDIGCEILEATIHRVVPAFTRNNVLIKNWMLLVPATANEIIQHISCLKITILTKFVQE